MPELLVMVSVGLLGLAGGFLFGALYSLTVLRRAIEGKR